VPYLDSKSVCPEMDMMYNTKLMSTVMSEVRMKAALTKAWRVNALYLAYRTSFDSPKTLSHSSMDAIAIV